MKKKYINPRILVEKMDISLLVDTSVIPVNQNERKPLDSSYNASNAAKTITINVIGDEEEEMTTGIRQLQITNDELPVYDLIGVTLS